MESREDGNVLKPAVARVMRLSIGFLALISCFILAESCADGAPICNLDNADKFKIPERWAARPVGARDFYIESPLEIQNQEVRVGNETRLFGEVPCWKQGVLRVSYGAMRDPDGTYYKEVLSQRDNPIIIYGRPKTMDTNALMRIKRDFGKRFLGVYALEWYSHPFLGNRGVEGVKTVCEEYKIPLVRNRDEAFHLFELHFKNTWGGLQAAGIPVYAGQATFMNHWECRMGVSITGEEIGGNERCTPMQLAFSRGASRQYDVPWVVYIASWGGGVVGDAETRYLFVRPDERRLNSTRSGGTYDVGPYSGTSWSLMKRMLYASYMAGTGVARKEGDKNAFFANFDADTVDSIPPCTLALQDRKTYLSPLGRIYERFYDTVTAGHERGIPYAPIALVFDKNHGCILEYSQIHTISCVPYGPGEWQTRAIINTVFPWEERRKETKSFESNTLVTGPFGDIFDVLTSDAGGEVLSSYRCLALVGNVRMNEGLEDRIKEHVKGGGVVFMAVAQMTPALWEAAGLEDGRADLQAKVWRVEGEDKRVEEDQSCTYRKAGLKGAEALIRTENGDPLVTIKREGKGAIVVGLAGWMTIDGPKPNRMLKVYSEVMGRIADELSPVKVSGNVEKLYNRNGKGWVVTLINNDGIYKYPGKKEVLKPEEAVEVSLEPRFAHGAVREWVTGAEMKELKLTVPPGDVRIVEIEEK
ncbi:MAG: hypothetical protein PHP98_01520 [Kiritimatiellae bacterium]|nr:hypothetical protein [Kiritimatiellia bacterium]